MLSNLQGLPTGPQTQRFQALELLNAIMLRHRSAICGLGSEALVGITDLVSGEKDPRNLMIVFSILNVIIAECDISGHVEVS